LFQILVFPTKIRPQALQISISKKTFPFQGEEIPFATSSLRAQREILTV
jgi:hypothetical protein